MKIRPLIEFELFHPSEIHPWNNSEGNDPYLTGYTLSQGFICFNVGDQKLLEYSPEIRAHWNDEVQPLADQMIESVYLDLIDPLGQFLRPIPEDLLWWMMPQRAAPGGRWITLCSHVWNDNCVVDCTLLANKICDAFAGRSLQRWDRLVQAPDINIWATETEVFVGWDNREKLVDGIPVWTASLGIQRVARDDFLAEMQDFRDRYFAAMTQQLSLVRSGVLKPEIRTDVELDAARVREDEAKPLTNYLAAGSRFEPTDWNEIRIALKQTLELTGFKLT